MGMNVRNDYVTNHWLQPDCLHRLRTTQHFVLVFPLNSFSSRASRTNWLSAIFWSHRNKNIHSFILNEFLWTQPTADQQPHSFPIGLQLDCLHGFCTAQQLSFMFVTCVGLNWLSVSLWSHDNETYFDLIWLLDTIRKMTLLKHRPSDAQFHVPQPWRRTIIRQTQNNNYNTSR